MQISGAILVSGNVVVQLKMLLQQAKKLIGRNSIRFVCYNTKWLPEPETFESKSN